MEGRREGREGGREGGRTYLHVKARGDEDSAVDVRVFALLAQVPEGEEGGREGGREGEREGGRGKYDKEVKIEEAFPPFSLPPSLHFKQRRTR